jgi:hypothetical protein
VDAASSDSANDRRNKKIRETVFILNEVHGKIAAQGTWELEVAVLFRLRGQEHELTMTVAVGPRRQTNSS